MIAKRFASITIVVLSAALFFGACESPSAQTQYEIRYAAMPLISQAPVVISQRRGFFAAEGIKLTLVPVSSGAQGLQALMAGSVDATHIADTPLINAAVAGLDVVAVADNGLVTKGNTQAALLVRDDSPIRSLADLKGKKIANLPPGTISDVQLKAFVLPALGLRPGTDVSFVVAGFPQMEGMLRAGTVDVIYQVEPFLTMMLRTGAFRVLSRLNEYIPERGSYLSMIVFRRNYLTSNPDVVRRFLRAYSKGVAEYIASAQERAEAMAELVKLPLEALSEIKPIEMRSDGKISVDALSAATVTLEKLGYLKKTINIGPHVDNSYLP